MKLFFFKVDKTTSRDEASSNKIYREVDTKANSFVLSEKMDGAAGWHVASPQMFSPRWRHFFLSATYWAEKTKAGAAAVPAQKAFALFVTEKPRYS